MEKAKRETYIDCLKIIAIILIINSHCDNLYPIKALATGGALGNSLFFICAGYLWGINVTIKKLLLKILRLYIPTWLVTLCFYWGKGDIIHKYVWPTLFWFIGAIVLFYALFYILDKLDIFSHYRIFLCISCLIYLGYYIFLLDTTYWVIETEGLSSIEGGFKLIYYFIIMSMGGYFRRKGIPEINVLTSSILVILSVVTLYITKYLFGIVTGFIRLQFINQVCVTLFAFSMFCLFKECKIVHRIKKTQTKTIIHSVSQLSLEIYQVQFTAIKVAGIFGFPANIFIAVLVIAFMSIILHIINWLIQKIVYYAIDRNQNNYVGFSNNED